MARKHHQTTGRHPAGTRIGSPRAGQGTAAGAGTALGPAAGPGIDSSVARPVRLEATMRQELAVGPFPNWGAATTWADFAAEHMARAAVPADVLVDLDFDFGPDANPEEVQIRVLVIVQALRLPRALGAARTLDALGKTKT